MGYPVEIKENNAAATGNWMPVSFKKSRIVARKINGMPVYKAKAYLNGLIDERVSLDDGKHNTNASKAILKILESAEKNAKNKNLSEKLRIKTIACEAGPKRIRFKGGGRRARAGGRQMKICHIKIVLEDMQPKKKETPTVEAKQANPEKKAEPKKGNQK